MLTTLEPRTAAGRPVVWAYWQQRRAQEVPLSFVDGRLYEYLITGDDPAIGATLAETYPQGVVPLVSARNLDYSPLQHLLVRHQFEEADRVTRKYLWELAGPAAVQRQWVYFTEVQQFPTPDLHTLDRLWWMHSEGKFGFRVQRQLWLNLGRDWDKLWPRIGWRREGTWTRYPKGFTWDLTAPAGHLPLTNQQRGVRLLEALLTHPAWTD